MGQFDGEFFKRRIKSLNKNQVECGNAMNISPMMVTSLLKNKRQLKLSEVESFAKFLEMSVPEVLTRSGLDMSDYIDFENARTSSNIPVFGSFHDHVIEELRDRKTIMCPSDVPEDARALMINEAGMFNNSHIIYSEKEGIDPNGIGRISLIEVEPNYFELGHILPSTKLDNYIVTTHAGKKYEQPVLRVSPVLHIRP